MALISVFVVILLVNVFSQHNNYGIKKNPNPDMDIRVRRDLHLEQKVEHAAGGEQPGEVHRMERNLEYPGLPESKILKILQSPRSNIPPNVKDRRKRSVSNYGGYPQYIENSTKGFQYDDNNMINNNVYGNNPYPQYNNMYINWNYQNNGNGNISTQYNNGYITRNYQNNGNGSFPQYNQNPYNNNSGYNNSGYSNNSKHNSVFYLNNYYKKINGAYSSVRNWFSNILNNTGYQKQKYVINNNSYVNGYGNYGQNYSNYGVNNSPYNTILYNNSNNGYNGYNYPYNNGYNYPYNNGYNSGFNNTNSGYYSPYNSSLYINNITATEGILQTLTTSTERILGSYFMNIGGCPVGTKRVGFLCVREDDYDDEK